MAENHQSEITTNHMWQGMPVYSPSSRSRTRSQQISGAACVRYAANITKDDFNRDVNVDVRSIAGERVQARHYEIPEAIAVRGDENHVHLNEQIIVDARPLPWYIRIDFWKLCVIAILIVSAIVTVVVLLPITLSSSSKSDVNLPSDPDAPSLIPAYMPTYTPTLNPQGVLQLDDGSNSDDEEGTRAPSLIPAYMPTYTSTLNPQGVLQLLYDSTNGPSWSNTWDFSSGQSYCMFDGITCDESEQITRIDLCCNNLEGSLPSEIGMLSSLTHLDLDINFITGTIPSEIGMLSSLYWLDLDFNSITGTISSEIGMLSSLTYLDLDDNSITGTIPSEIGMLLSLRYLDLHQNSITGTIPSEIGMLSSSFWVDLDNNSITGTIPTELCALTNTFILYDASKISCTCIDGSYIEGTTCN